MTKDFILASGSPQRKTLLEQIGFAPKAIISADIDETPNKKEKATAYVKRMALEKALAVAILHEGNIVLAADTIVVAGATIIQKAKNNEEQEKIMQLLSGNAHRVLTAICVVSKCGKPTVRLSTTKVHMKNLSSNEIKSYVDSQEWLGCSGYKIEGSMEAFVRKINGSHSGIIGLPLFETKNLLNGAGII